MIRPSVGFAAREGVEDLVERHDDVVELLLRHAEKKLQRQERAGHQARHGDFLFAAISSRVNARLPTSIGP